MKGGILQSEAANKVATRLRRTPDSMIQTECQPDSAISLFLIERVGRRDEEAIEELYRRHAPAVFRFVYRRVDHQREDAEEITLDMFHSAVSLAPSYRSGCAILTWLCGIARVRIIDFRRRRGRDKRVPRSMMTELPDLANQIPCDDAAIGHWIERMDAKQLVDQVMRLLSEDERDAVLMRYVEQYSVKEIAAILRRSEKGVEALLTRAKKKQREYAIRVLGYRN